VADTFFHREVVARAQHNNETVEVTQDTAGKLQREITHGQGVSLALIMPTMMPKGPMKNMNQTKYPDKTVILTNQNSCHEYCRTSTKANFLRDINVQADEQIVFKLLSLPTVNTSHRH